jgi:hypothetical protein
MGMGMVAASLTVIIDDYLALSGPSYARLHICVERRRHIRCSMSTLFSLNAAE